MRGAAKQLAMLGLFGAMALCGSTAEAAKGVKKAAGNPGQQTVSGEVLKVQQNNGVGSFFLRTATNHKKQAAAANGAIQRGGREYQINAATRFEGPNGAKASLASLQPGERVRVIATGQQANQVHILTSHAMRRMPHHYYGGYRRGHHYHRGVVHRHRPRTHVVHHHRHHSRAAHHHGHKKR